MKKERIGIGQKKKKKEGVGCAARKQRKERGEIRNEDGREIRWMKEIWKRREGIIIESP
jgi:hypothetical protein